MVTPFEMGISKLRGSEKNALYKVFKVQETFRLVLFDKPHKLVYELVVPIISQPFLPVSLQKTEKCCQQRLSLYAF